MNIRFVILSVCLALFAVVPIVPAQQAESLSGVRYAIAQHPRDFQVDILATKISLDLRQVPLKNAVQAIADQAGVAITFGDVVEKSARRVTIVEKSVLVRDALQQALVGTGITYRSLGNQLVLERAASHGARQNGVITGRVIHAKTKQPVPGARVLLGDGTVSAVTAQDGTFRLAAGVGEQTIQVRAVGFARQVKRVTMAEEQTETIEFVLEPSASVLDEVIVTGTIVATARKEIPTPITVITAADIEQRGVTRLEQLFRGEVPGFIALDRGVATYAESSQGAVIRGASLYARGSASLAGEANPAKTYVDGVELLDPSYLETIDPASIERIEIITGPQAATIYGSGAMGGVIQIFTKMGRGRGTPDVRLDLKYGMLQSNILDGRAPAHNHQLNVMGGVAPGFSYAGTLSYNFSGAWRPGLFQQSYGASLGATHTRGTFVGSGTVALTNGRNGTYGNDNTGFNEIGGYPSAVRQALRLTGDFIPSPVIPTQRISASASQMVSFNVDYRMRESWQHHLTLGRNQTRFSLRPERPMHELWADTLYKTSFSNGERTTVGYNMTLSPRWHAVAATMTVGVNGSWSGEGSGTQGCMASESSTSIIGCNGPATAPVVSRTPTRGSWGGFGSWRVGGWDRVFVSFGVRAELNQAYGKEHRIDWTPTYGATYSLEFRELTVKFLSSYGRATRQPTPGMRDEVYIIQFGTWTPAGYVSQWASPNLTPEVSRGPQGGVEVYYGNRGSLAINHFQQRIASLIQLVRVDTAWLTNALGNTNQFAVNQYMNGANMRQTGWEGTGSLNLRRVTFKGTYSWNDSRITKLLVPASYQAGAAFRYNPTHFANVTAGYAAGGTTVTVVTNWVGASLQYGGRTAENLLRVDGWARLKEYVDRRRGESGFVSASGYTRVNIMATQRLFPWASATMNIMNAGNNFTSDFGALFPALGRQTTVGLSLRNPTTR